MTGRAVGAHHGGISSAAVSIIRRNVREGETGLSLFDGGSAFGIPQMIGAGGLGVPPPVAPVLAVVLRRVAHGVERRGRDLQRVAPLDFLQGVSHPWLSLSSAPCTFSAVCRSSCLLRSLAPRRAAVRPTPSRSAQRSLVWRSFLGKVIRLSWSCFVCWLWVQPRMLLDRAERLLISSCLCIKGHAYCLP